MMAKIVDGKHVENNRIVRLHLADGESESKSTIIRNINNNESYSVKCKDGKTDVLVVGNDGYLRTKANNTLIDNLDKLPEQ